jgi:hypothetical protein
MGIGCRLLGRLLVGRPCVMTAKFEACPIWCTRRIDVQPGACHREGVAVHQQGKDEEVGGLTAHLFF